MASARDLPAAPTFGPPPQYPIESVDNALKVLLLIGQRSSVRLTDVSRYLDVASSTAHRLLSMLLYRGLVRQDPATRTYVPGRALDEMAFSVLRRLDFRERAHPVLELLNEELGETVHLGQLENTDVYFVDAIESSRPLRVGSRLGRTAPAHTTSTGKALLATLTDDELRRLYPSEDIPHLATTTIDSRTKLLAALRTVRRHGYATSREESDDGVRSLAIALHQGHGPRLAVTISVPRTRMSASDSERILVRLRSAVEELEKVLF